MVRTIALPVLLGLFLACQVSKSGRPETAPPTTASPASRAPASMAAPTTGKVAQYMYYGSFDHTLVKAAPGSPIDRSTLLVIRPPTSGPELLVDNGETYCIHDAYRFTFEEMCQARYRVGVCPDDKIAATYDGLEGVMVNRRPACSGVAIGDRRIAAALHCFDAPKKQPKKMVGGVAIAGALAGTSPDMCFAKRDVFDLTARYVKHKARDIVMIEVEPRVESATLAPPEFCLGDVEKGDLVHSRGHPFGFPQFDSGDADVLDVHPLTRQSLTSIEADLDQLEGNSGSPVYRVDRNCLVGLAVSDHNPAPMKKCCGFDSRKPDKNYNTKIGVIDPNYKLQSEEN